MSTNELLCRYLAGSQERDALYVKYVTDFSLIWNDRRSGADSNGSFWLPKVPEGYHAVGHFGWGSYDDPSNREAVVVVKSAPGHDALRPPTDYKLLWTDKKSGASMNGSVWEPIAPDGYVALGTVVVREYDKPSPNAVMCVRKDLTELGVIGDLIWSDRGSGASGNFSAWRFGVSDRYADRYCRLQSGSFIGSSAYDKPQSSAVSHVLKLIMPVEKYAGNTQAVQGSSLAERQQWLIGQGVPTSGNHTDWLVIRQTYVPFLGIKDDAVSVRDKIQKYPFYVLERSECWRCEQVEWNAYPVPTQYKLTATTGWSKQDREQFQHTAGVKIGLEYEVKAGVEGVAEASTRVSTEFSYEFGFTQEQTTSLSKERSVERNPTLDPNGAAALWVRSVRLRVLRKKGDEGQVVSSSVLNTDDVATAGYTKDARPFEGPSQFA